MPSTADLIADAREAEKANGLPDGLLVAMIQQESGFDPNIHPSKAGALGIAQFMPDTAAGIGLDPSDAHASIWAAARMVKDDAVALNGGKAPTSTSMNDDAWLKAAAAYDAGRGGVEAAQKKAVTVNNTPSANPVNFLTAGVFGSKSWRDELPDETKDYLNKITSGGNIGSWQDAAKASTYGKKNASSSGGASGMAPVTSALPDINKYQRKDENGNQYTDPQFYTDMGNYAKAQETLHSLQSGPLAQYVDDTIKDIQSQLESGKLDLNKANDLLTTKVNSLKNANDVYSSDAFRRGAPVGAASVPGALPGQTIPFASSGFTLNPLQQALDINNQAGSLIGNIQTPQTPSLASIMGSYQGQYGGQVPSPQGQSSAPLAAALPSAQQNGAAPTGPVTYTGFNNQPSQQPPPAPPPDNQVTNGPTSNANASDVAALARILAQQAQGLGAPN